VNLTERLAAQPMSNPRADRVKDVAGLAGRSARSKRGLFLAEGPQNAREALARHLESPCVDAVYVTEDALTRHPDIAGLLERVAEDRSVFARLVTRDVLAAMSDAVTPQGVVAVCRTLHVPAETVLAARPRLVAVLARVQDPGNAGTVLRAADAAGLDVLDAGYDLARPTVWLFGNEAQGLSEQEKALADHRVAVPVHGRAESLNVGTAATVCLYASARAQRRGARPA
jgi:TrmH family RNA methyltransferase